MYPVQPGQEKLSIQDPVSVLLQWDARAENTLQGPKELAGKEEVGMKLYILLGIILLIPPATPFGIIYFICLYIYKKCPTNKHLSVVSTRPNVNKLLNSKEYKKIQELNR